MMPVVYLVLIVFFLGLTGMAACAETAYTSANVPRLRELAAAGDGRAKTALWFIESPDRFLVTTLMNNNLWNVTLVTVAQLAVAAYIVDTDLFRGIVTACGGDPEDGWDELVTSVLMTVAGLIFAEILPKAIARGHADALALFFARPLRLSDRLLRLVVPIGLITGTSRRIIHWMGADRAPAQATTREDLKLLARAADDQNLMHEDVGDMLVDALEVNERPVTAVMVPLSSIRAVSGDAALAEAEALAAETGFRRMPVYSGRIDRIAGMLDLRALAARRGALPDAAMLASPVRNFMDAGLAAVPDTMPAGRLWDVFSADGPPQVFVVNEYGGVLGMVTREDLALSLTGWLHNTREKQASARYRRIDLDTIECSAFMEVRELEDILACDIPAEGFSTLAGLVMKLAGRVPEPGAEFDAGGFTVKVLAMDGWRLDKVLVTEKPGEAQG